MCRARRAVHRRRSPSRHCRVDAVNREQAACDVELRQRGADGVYRLVHAKSLPVRDADGCILRWFVLQTDVDGASATRRRSRVRLEELAKSERNANHHRCHPLSSSSRSGLTAHFCPRIRAVPGLHGPDEEEVRTESLGDVFHPEDTEGCARPTRSGDLARFVRYERRVRRRDASVSVVLNR